MPNLQNPAPPQELLIAGAALKAGIFDFFHKSPAKIDDIIQALSLDYRAAWTVMEALISLGYIKRDGEVLRLTPEADRMFFSEGSEDYIGYSLIHTFNIIRAWTNLPEILKTGKKPPGRERDLQDAKGFMAAMKRKSNEVSTQLTAICLAGLSKNPTVLDIGGGPLNYARPFAAAGAAVTVQDLPEICALMEPTLSPEENISFVPGDFTKEITRGSFELAFLGNICHIYGPRENMLLFTRVYDSLRNGGKIAILDFVRGVSKMAELFAVNMLANTESGGTWTVDQYTEWLSAAGFSEVKIHSIGDRQVITATK